MASIVQNRLKTILLQYVVEVQAIFGPSLKKVILYGSYARGDYSPESDIDIMILVDLDESGIRNLRHRLSDITFDVNYDYDTQIRPVVQNFTFFERWIGAYPFFNNVNNEGIEFYTA